MDNKVIRAGFKKKTGINLINMGDDKFDKYDKHLESFAIDVFKEIEIIRDKYCMCDDESGACDTCRMLEELTPILLKKLGIDVDPNVSYLMSNHLL